MRGEAHGTGEFIGSMTAQARRALAHAQPWPHQFRRRSLEMRALCGLQDFRWCRRVLELGCGNAFGSALLSAGRELMVATDLASPDVQSHSIGLGKARELVSGLGLKYCRVMAASGEALPYRDQSFDLVFSLFVLEHIGDRDRCLAEMHRVLERGGLAVHAVPGAMWVADAPLRFYVYLAGRLLAHVAHRREKRGFAALGPHDGGCAAAGTAGLWRLFRERYPQFPLPPPHGAYRSYREELAGCSRSRWVELFERHGFRVLACRPIMVLPLGLFHMFLGEMGFTLYEHSFGLDQWLCGRKALQALGRFYGIVAVKPP